MQAEFSHTVVGVRHGIGPRHEVTLSQAELASLAASPAAEAVEVVLSRLPSTNGSGSALRAALADGECVVELHAGGEARVLTRHDRFGNLAGLPDVELGVSKAHRGGCRRGAWDA